MAYYRSTPPSSQQTFYREQENIDFHINLQKDEAVEMGSVRLEGRVTTYVTGSTAVTANTRLYYDNYVGSQALTSQLTVVFDKFGTLENNMNYPRYVKHHAVATLAPESLGTQTDNSVELRVATQAMTKGMLEGQFTRDLSLPFSNRLYCCLNDASDDIPSALTGNIMIRIRTPPTNQWVFGEDYVAGTNYKLEDIMLTYNVVKAVPLKAPLILKVTNSAPSVAIASTQVNISQSSPGLSNAVSLSFISQERQNDAGSYNYLAMMPPPGKPPVGAGISGGSETDTGHYGVERCTYAVNDTDTALVGFTFESREEIAANGLRVFGEGTRTYSALIRNYSDPDQPDCYLMGMPFGKYIDFSSTKFGLELQTQCTQQDQYQAYLFFHSAIQIYG